MRWFLTKSFDRIQILDLHGNAKKREQAKDGTKDENVFAIQQGVSINVFIKKSPNSISRREVLVFEELLGSRNLKLKFLDENSVRSVSFQRIECALPMCFFMIKDFQNKDLYDAGFQLNDMFPVNSVGIVTSRDNFVIDGDSKELSKRIRDFFEYPTKKLIENYGLKESSSWKITETKKKAVCYKKEFLVKLNYRLFDSMYLYYDDCFIERARLEVMQHFLIGPNLGLALCKQFKAGETYQHVFLSDKIIESSYASNKTSEITSLFPLFVYQLNKKTKKYERSVNIDSVIIQNFEGNLGLEFKDSSEETRTQRNNFSAYDLFDYIYAVLHSPDFRNIFKDFLKTDFPKIPYPKNRKSFWELVAKGSELRETHLLVNSVLKKLIAKFQIAGTNKVDSLKYEDKKVYINKTQFFDGVPEIAWNFFIGGYQPAQKWLKDRKGRILSDEDIIHYQKIIVALTESDRIMKEIDEVIEKHGGWDKVFVTAADAEKDD